MSNDATSYSEEHDRTEYNQDCDASNLELSLCYLLTSSTTRPLRRTVGSLLHGLSPVTTRPLRRDILNLLYDPRPVVIWILRRVVLNIPYSSSPVIIPTWKIAELLIINIYSQDSWS